MSKKKLIFSKLAGSKNESMHMQLTAINCY